MEVKLISKTVGVGEFEGKSIEDIIVYCARVSSSREDKFDKPEGLLKYCINNNHWSIFETGSITIEINTSRAIAAQILRHKSFSFQELSQRYTAVNEFEPIELRQQAVQNRQSSTEEINPEILFNNEKASASYVIQKHLDESQKIYCDLIEAGVAKECARMVLPLSTKTKLYMTGSIRSWIHYLDVRCDQHTQKEHRDIALAIKEILKLECPIIFNIL